MMNKCWRGLPFSSPCFLYWSQSYPTLLVKYLQNLIPCYSVGVTLLRFLFRFGKSNAFSFLSNTCLPSPHPPANILQLRSSPTIQACSNFLRASLWRLSCPLQCLSGSLWLGRQADTLCHFFLCAEISHISGMLFLSLHSHPATTTTIKTYLVCLERFEIIHIPTISSPFLILQFH